MGGEEPLGLAGGLEPTHWPLPLTGRLMGACGTVIHALVLAVFDAGNDLLAGGFIALELIGDDDPWHVVQSFERLAEKALGSTLVTPRLNPNVQQSPS